MLTLDLASHGLSAGKRVVTKAVVPLTAIGRWGLGSALPVRIDRENPDDSEIVWDEAGARLAPGAGVAVRAGQHG